MNAITKTIAGIGMALAMTSAQAIVIDFDDLAPGTVVDGSISDLVTITTDGFSSGSPDVAVVFDTGNPTGGDFDLEAPFFTNNPDIPNEYNPNNILIIQENGTCNATCANPDDDANGGIIKFEFSSPVTINSIDVFDVEENESSGTFELYVFAMGMDDELLGTFSIPVTGGDNTWDRVTFDGLTNVGTFGVMLAGSGAIDRLDFTVVPVPPAVLLFGSALALLAGVRRRISG